MKGLMIINNPLIFREVLNLNDSEILRLVRNQCYEFMTSHNKPITYQEQIDWFKSKIGNKKVFLIYILVGSFESLCGYGLIAYDNNEARLTGCILNEYRGRGLGELLFKSLIDMIDDNLTISLDVLIDNERALTLYKKLGFKIESTIDSRIYRMILNRRI